MSKEKLNYVIGKLYLLKLRQIGLDHQESHELFYGVLIAS